MRGFRKEMTMKQSLLDNIIKNGGTYDTKKYHYELQQRTYYSFEDDDFHPYWRVKRFPIEAVGTKGWGLHYDVVYEFEL